ncbi:hypothetical protein BpHYR1_004904 [Brachionus plicatilis]|uniref:Uncharacterized protein n=1 Tax=Brachionus plicatilis TaxID=10195 RepID=A0A3M7RQH1_BRAPC|nr:hypothetical protein BpHYR1_004904 [Brachionus plicatilis]
MWDLYSIQWNDICCTMSKFKSDKKDIVYMVNKFFQSHNLSSLKEELYTITDDLIICHIKIIYGALARHR